MYLINVGVFNPDIYYGTDIFCFTVKAVLLCKQRRVMRTDYRAVI